MLSKLEIMFNLDEESVAYLLKDVKNPKIGSEMLVYIPRIMQNINNGQIPENPSPVEGDVCTYQYNNCFINADECKPKVSQGVFRSQNYLTGLYDNGSNAAPVLTVIRKPNKELISVKIDKNTKLRSLFTNGKLNQLRIYIKDTTEDLSYDKESNADEIAKKESVIIRK